MHFNSNVNDKYTIYHTTSSCVNGGVFQQVRFDPGNGIIRANAEDTPRRLVATLVTRNLILYHHLLLSVFTDAVATRSYHIRVYVITIDKCEIFWLNMIYVTFGAPSADQHLNYCSSYSRSCAWIVGTGIFQDHIKHIIRFISKMQCATQLETN